MAHKKEQQLVINQIITRPANRQILDVGKWRTALRSADMGKYQQLLDMYDDIMLDGVLADAIDKRIRAVTGADLTFQYKNGTEGEEMIKLIDTLEFEQLLTEIMLALFHYVSVIELTFDEKGMHVYSVPRKHIRTDQHSIAINENDPQGIIPYADTPNIIEVRNPKDKYGVLIRACPYAIFKRGGLSDWAQMVEIFGMPKRIGKYSIYDVETRKALEDAFNSQGAAATLIVPKETEIETDNSTTAVNSTLYKDFINTLDEQLLITILSQTMTTKNGSSRSQSETHKEVQEELNKHDLRFVQRALNQKVLPLLEARGYPVKDGTFVFPKATELPTVSDLVQLSNILDIPAYYIQERYGIPQAADGDILAKRNSPEQQPAQSTPNAKLSDVYAKEETNFFMRLRDFFVDAPTLRSGANRNFIGKWTNSIINATDKIRYHVDINRLFEQAIREVYANAGEEAINATLYELCNKPLQQAVTKGFTTSWGKKNETFLKEFRQNTAVFAAFKAHRQGNEIAAKLLDENGELRSFHEFKKAVLGSSINADYNKNWLKTEYNMAVRAARNAEKFKRYEEVKHLYPNLEYVESTAAHKREEHLNYVGTVLPIEHPWWDTHMPPLDWGCECSIRNTDKPVTSVPDDETPINPVLANNPAKTAEFMNINKHPYLKELDEKTKNLVLEFTKNTLGLFFIKKCFRNGGMVLSHPANNKKAADYKAILTIVTSFARNGEIAVMMPKLHPKSDEYKSAYKELISTIYEGKSPDMKIGNLFYEYESYQKPFKKRKIANMISHGAKQSPYIIIDNTNGVSHRYIRRNINMRLRDKSFTYPIEEVWTYEKGKLHLVYKKQ